MRRHLALAAFSLLALAGCGAGTHGVTSSPSNDPAATTTVPGAPATTTAPAPTPASTPSTAAAAAAPSTVAPAASSGSGQAQQDLAAIQNDLNATDAASAQTQADLGAAASAQANNDSP